MEPAIWLISSPYCDSVSLKVYTALLTPELCCPRVHRYELSGAQTVLGITEVAEQQKVATDVICYLWVIKCLHKLIDEIRSRFMRNI